MASTDYIMTNFLLVHQNAVKIILNVAINPDRRCSTVSDKMMI